MVEVIEFTEAQVKAMDEFTESFPDVPSVDLLLLCIRIVEGK